MVKNTTPKESEEQINFVNYCKTRNIIVLSTQNGMYVPKKTDDGTANFNHFGYIRRQKAMGLEKGFPDLIILAKNSQHECFFIEIKRVKGGKLKPEQDEWIKRLDAEGYCVGVAYGCDAAIRLLNKYLEM